MSPRTARLLPLLLVAIGGAFLFRVWARPGILYSPHSDTVALGAGLHAVERRAVFAEHRWPLWDPSTDAGVPAHASPVASYLFPLDWTWLVLPLGPAQNATFVLTVLLAGLTMHAFARRRLERPEAALFCGVAYMLSYRYLAMLDAGWLTAISMYALFPALVLSAELVLERASGRRTALLSVLLALSAMQGSVQSFYYSLLFMAVFVAWRLRGLPGPARPRTALVLLAAGALAFLLASPDLLPRLQFASLSTRTERSYAFFLSDVPRLRDLATLLDPRDGGGTRPEYWENNFYFGLFLYPLMAWAVFRERRRAAPWLAVFAACVLLCFDTPLLRLAYEALPGFAAFRRSTRLLPFAQFAAVYVAGLGADALLRGPWRRREAWAAAALCALPLLDAGPRMLPRLQNAPVAEVFPEPAFADRLKRAPDSGRVAAIGRAAIAYGQASVFGIDLVNGYEPLNLRHFIEYFAVLQTGDVARVPRAPVVWADLRAIAKPDLLRALDARWIVASRPQPLEPLGWEPAGRKDDAPAFELYRGVVRAPVFLWRDRRPLGPAFFARSVAPAGSEADSLSALAASSSPLDARAFGWDGRPLDLSGGTAVLTRRDTQSCAYEVNSRGTNFLILSQVWYPGWRARLDGAPLRLYRTNHALLGCVVPAGRHALDLEMTSPPLRLGLALAALAAAALVALAVRNPVIRA